MRYWLTFLKELVNLLFIDIIWRGVVLSNMSPHHDSFCKVAILSNYLIID
jgi:hypothetical protein